MLVQSLRIYALVELECLRMLPYMLARRVEIYAAEEPKHFRMSRLLNPNSPDRVVLVVLRATFYTKEEVYFRGM